MNYPNLTEAAPYARDFINTVKGGFQNAHVEAFAKDCWELSGYVLALSVGEPVAPVEPGTLSLAMGHLPVPEAEAILTAHFGGTLAAAATASKLPLVIKALLTFAQSALAFAPEPYKSLIGAFIAAILSVTGQG